MNTIYSLILTMRPKQWTKNVLFVFPAIVFNAQLFHQESFIRVAICSLLMTLAAGCVYIINDIVDVDSDRQHPNKSKRPIAAGDISISFARLSALVLAIAVLLLSYSFDRRLALLLLAYILLQIMYSLFLRNVVLLDILVVTTGFLLRIVAGGLVINVTLSPWLTTAGGLLALFLVIGKRRQELALLGDQAPAARSIFQHYNLALLDDMMRIVTTCIMITYIIYTVESPTLIKHGQNLGLITVPIVIYG
ncbi:MAG: UbiA family prenyltransferase, partial [Chloroflexi bacterium]|nr:UbiA family prenyltransferase [Chloroflexota bacterium]